MSSMRYPLGALLARTHARYVADCEQRLAAAGFPDLAVSHGTNILRHLSPGERLRVSDIVRRSGITKQAVSQQLAYLSAHGYLSVAADERDARAKTAALTPRGEESQRTIRRIFSEVQHDWRERYGAERMAALIDVLQDVSGLDAAP